eukprot:5990944-Amphidinium_carterae.1
MGILSGEFCLADSGPLDFRVGGPLRVWRDRDRTRFMGEVIELRLHPCNRFCCRPPGRLSHRPIPGGSFRFLLCSGLIGPLEAPTLGALPIAVVAWSGQGI